MNPLVGTLGYLIGHTLRNRVVSMARRLRRPKYALGLIAVLAYFGLLIFGGTRGGRVGGPAPFQSDTVHALAPLLLLVVLVSSWFTGGAQSALAYTQAEVSFLFPAPVTRRQLLLYKLVGAQVPIILNALIFTFIFGRGPAAIPKWLAVVSLWTAFATIHLHRLGAALVRSSTVEHGLAGARRHWVSQLIGLVIMVAVGVSIGTNQSHLDGASGPVDAIEKFVQLLQLPAARAALYPFALILGPAFAGSTGAWFAAMGPALLMLVVHLVWVLRSQAAFEEAAAEASARRQALVSAMRRGGLSAANAAPPKGKRTFAIAATGHPAMAIVWKNLLCLVRTFRPMQFVSMLTTPVVVAIAIGSKTRDPAAVVAIMAGMTGLMLFMMGGMIIRNDLRADLLNLELLKTLPLRGRDLLLAEVSSLAIPLAVAQAACLAVAAISVQLSRHPMSAAIAIGATVAMPVGVVALNLCMATIQNGVAVVFPGWVRPGEAGNTGIEVIGPALLGTLAKLVAFLLCLIAPAIVAWVVLFIAKPPTVVAVPFVVIVGAIAVAAEAYGITVWLGKSLERMEPQHVG